MLPCEKNEMQEKKYNVETKIDTGYRDKVLAQELYNALIIVSDTYKDKEVTFVNDNGVNKTAVTSGRHDEKYNVVYMIRAMLKNKNSLHKKTVKILDIIHNQLCSEGF